MKERLLRWLRQPALHMALLGLALYGGSLLWGAGVERPRIEVEAHRIEALMKNFLADRGRLPDEDERQAMLDALIDDEVLFQYALTLGMHENTAARTRLAQIADFVEANPHGHAGDEERAHAAMELGLHHGDLVVRRILTDSARRLIRAVVLLQPPTEAQLRDFLAANPQEFSRPATCRLSQVAANGFKWPDSAARARELRGLIDAGALSLEAALALGDEGAGPARTEALDEKSLATQFGADFAAAVMKLPAGRWSDPIASRYGAHLVFVHEQTPAALPALDEVRPAVDERLRQRLADEWLGLRLRELRHEYEIVLPPGVSL